ncbi:MAG: hypothetical protein V4495_19815 [Pseudomonadota bacterium]
METTLLTTVVAGSSALLGVALTSIVNLRTLRQNQYFQFDLEERKRYHELAEKRREEALQRLAAAHKALSFIKREFSPTNLDITWRARMSDSEYDQKYLSLCLEIDNLKVFAALYEIDLVEDVEYVYKEMNAFWGNFKEVLRMASLGKPVDANTLFLQKSHEAALLIGKKTTFIQSRVSDRASKYQERQF